MTHSHKKLIFTFIVCLFFPLFPDYLGLTLEYLLTVTLIIYFSYAVYNVQKVSGLAFILSIVYFFLLLTSLVRSTDILEVKDFFELSKPLMFFLFFIYSYSQVQDEVSLKYINVFLLRFFFVMVLLAVLEAVLPAVNTLFSFLYKSQRSVVQFKAVLSFISPYTLASILMLPVGYSLIRLFIYRKYLSSSIVFVLSFSSLVLTQSRTVLISFCVTTLIFGIVLCFKSWLPNKRTYRLVFISTICVVILSLPVIWLYMEENLRYLYSGLSVVFNNLDKNFYSLIYSTPSISNRYEQLMEVIGYQDSIPLIGAAIGKGVFYPESFYALYLLRVGLLGILLHFSILYFAYKATMQLAKYYSNSDIKSTCFFLSLGYYFMSLPFSYFSSAVNDQTRSGFIFYFILGLVFSAKKLLLRKTRTCQ